MTAVVDEQAGPTPLQHRTMHRAWKLAGVADRDDRLALTGAVVRRELRSSSDLTEAEAEQVIRYQRWLLARGLLAERAGRWLAAHRRRSCTCAPCTTPGRGHPLIEHCAACCAGSGIEEYDDACPDAEHREMARRQSGLPLALEGVGR